jgi:hypothetical protein
MAHVAVFVFVAHVITFLVYSDNVGLCLRLFWNEERDAGSSYTVQAWLTLRGFINSADYVQSVVRHILSQEIIETLEHRGIRSRDLSI